MPHTLTAESHSVAEYAGLIHRRSEACFRRVDTVVAGAAVVEFRGLTEVFEQQLPATLRALRVGHHALHAFAVDGAARALAPGEVLMRAPVFEAVEQHAFGGFTVASRTARLLVIGLERPGH